MPASEAQWTSGRILRPAIATVMRTLLLFILCAVIPLVGFSQPPFQKLYLNGSEGAQALGASPMPDGGNAMVGLINLPGQNPQVYVSRLACDGSELWTRLLGNSSSNENIFPHVMADNAGRIWFTSNIGVWNNYDGLVGCFSPDGELLKAVRLGTGGRNDQLYGLGLGEDGSVFVCGATNSWGSDKTSSPVFHDVFVARLDSNLNMLWARTFGTKDSIDTGHALALDKDGNVWVTGRMIVNGTFFAFLLHMDSEGNTLDLKGYGESTAPHRTYGYGLTATEDGYILLTGSTTINKENHLSPADAFLIKTDGNGNPVFRQIFTPVLGNDESESGSSVVEMHDGRYAIGVPTMSFTTHTVGFVPNKNAVFVTESDGTLSEARIYNPGGSHYTKLYRRNEGYLLSNYSNFYSQPNPGAGPFRPLVIVTDRDLASGCHELDVTAELALVQESWQTLDIPFNPDTAYAITPYLTATPYAFLGVETLCETADSLAAILDLPAEICEGEPLTLTADTSGNVLSLSWTMGDGSVIQQVLDTVYTYSTPGTFNIVLSLVSACSMVQVEHEIVVLPAPRKEAQYGICEGDSVLIGSNWVKVAGTYTEHLSGPGCDTILTVMVEVQPWGNLSIDTLSCIGDTILIGGIPVYENGTYMDTIPDIPCPTVRTWEARFEPCDCGIDFPNLFTPNGDQTNDAFGAVIICPISVTRFALKIYDRWGKEVFATSDPNVKWDGTNGGTDQPSDVYGWVMSASYLEAEEMKEVTKRGEVTLMR